MKIARGWVGEATVRFNKVQRLFKLHLTWSNLTNSEHASNGFKLKRVSSLTVFLHIVLEAFELSWNLFIDAASHISQSRQRVCVCVCFKRKFVRRLFTFLHDVIDEFQSKALQWVGTWMNLPKIAYVKINHGPINFFHSLSLWVKFSRCNFRAIAERVCWE